VSSVEVVAPDKVRLVLSKPDLDLEVTLAGYAGSMISPAALADPARAKKLVDTPDGSGPYKLDSFQADASINFVRNDSYWDPTLRAAKLQLVGISNEQTRLNSFKAGELDGIFLSLPQLDTVKGLTASLGAKLYQFPSLLYYGLFLRSGHDLFTDVKVRQAIASSIDKATIAKTLFNGNCTVTDQPFPDGHPLHVAGLKSLPYDPAKAKDLLKQAGVSNLTFTVIGASSSPTSELGTILQAELAAVGVTMKIQISAATNAKADFWTTQGGDAAISNNLPSEGYANSLDTTFTDTKYGFNIGGFVPPDVATLRQTASSSASPDDRNKIFRDIISKMSDAVVEVPICGAINPWVFKSNIANVDTMGLTQINLWEPRNLVALKG
jgi:ABC-type transport system substrate-binding protein